MTLGLSFSNGSDGSDIVPYVKYDARAGRLFRNDRSEHDGVYSNNQVEITNSFRAVFDMENIEVGFIHFAAGNPPAYLLVKLGEELPARPEGKWKQGVRVMLKLDTSCGGDVREITSNAQAFLKGFDDLHTRYETEKHQNPGKLPIVTLPTTKAITSGSGDKKSTNYEPTFAITGWAARPANLVHVPKQPTEDQGPPF